MIKNEKQKVTWNDLHSATQQEIKQAYGLDSKGLENQVRAHLDGASMTERKQIYQQFYARRK